MTAGAVLVAAGSGERFGAGVSKAYVELSGQPLLVWVVEAFSSAGLFQEIVVVSRAGDIEQARSLIGGQSPIRWMIVEGGATRQDSVRCGLDALSERVDLVAIHDVARPLVSTDLIRRVVRTAERSGAAIAGIPAADTVHQTDDSGVIVATPLRARLYLAQTPQVFRRDLLTRAHLQASAEGRGETDDAALVAAIGQPVRIEAGETSNRKITVPEDLAFAEACLAARRSDRQT